MPRLRGRSHFGAAKARCSAAGLHFHTILAGFNAPLEFLTGFTAEVENFVKYITLIMSKSKHPQFRDGCGLKEGEMDGVAEIRKVLCYEWQKMSSYLVNIRNVNKNSFSILMS